MAIFLSDLYRDTKRIYHLNLISGTGGMNNIVNWVYVSEDISTGSFLNGGELVITTGVSSGEREDWLYTFVRELIRHGTSGLILNVGKYIYEDDITGEIVRLCSKYNFPLFTMPWETKIYDISHDYTSRIFEDARADDNLTSAFRSILAGKPLSELQEKAISESDFANGVCCVFFVSTAQNKSIQSEKLQEALHRELNGSDFRYHLLSCDGGYLAVIVCGDSERDAHSCRLIADRLAGGFESEHIHAGLGSATKCLSELGKSCRRARAAAMFAAHTGRTFCNFNELGFYRILIEADDEQLQTDYINEQLGRVVEYDAKHNSALTETLRQYLEKSGSVQAISQAMFCHRNTINYRLRTIKELGYDLGSADERFRLMAAYRMLELRRAAL